jgi:hypothetical protein
MNRNDIKSMIRESCNLMGALLCQNYRLVGTVWWLYNGDTAVRELSENEVAWHVARNHYPFVPNGVRSKDPAWWNEPATEENLDT